jgi:hypothetical protein
LLLLLCAWIIAESKLGNIYLNDETETGLTTVASTAVACLVASLYFRIQARRD